MIEEVNKIIYNMLISGRGVFLPGVGTLFIERQGARRIDKNRLMSPRNVVAFSSQEQAPSLVDEIVAIAGCQRAQAEDIYERWIAKTREGADVTVGGVGVLRGKSFIVDKNFNSTINPKGVRTLVVRKKSSHAWIYAVCGVAVAIALAFFVYLQWAIVGSLLRRISQNSHPSNMLPSSRQRPCRKRVLMRRLCPSL